MKRVGTLSLLLVFSLGCTRKRETTESYQVVSHETSSGEWVIIRMNNENHSRVRITAVCDFYQWGEHEALIGPDSCDLVVGETLVPNRSPTNRRDFLDVWQSGEKLHVTRDNGPDRVLQQFNVRSAQVIQQ